MHGTTTPSGIVLAHRERSAPALVPVDQPLDRHAREAIEAAALSPGATRASGAGTRARTEVADPVRTCFERDRDRVLHAAAFRRLAGKTQVFVRPADHQRTRLTHALEVAQVATAIARATGLNVALTEAIALAHDCGHGPGGHASEAAFAPYLPGGFHHAPWGADVTLTPLNLCAETLDGVRNHSWSRPSPSTPEGVVVSWADRIAYCAHDLEDAVHAGIVSPRDLPTEVVATLGATRAEQLCRLINAVVTTVVDHGVVGMSTEPAEALGALRAFNYERIYTRAASVAQERSVIEVLRALAEFYLERPQLLPGTADIIEADPVTEAVAYVNGMTDRFAFDAAVRLLGWAPERLPQGIDVRAAG
jgi:dGTPase